MGLLVDGVWRGDRYDTKSTDGRFVRKDSTIRNWITPDGSPGPSGAGGFRAERDRYHLYVSLACPWAHRTLVSTKLKGLESMIGVSIVHWLMLENGWTFADGPGVVPDPVHGARFLHEVYREPTTLHRPGDRASRWDKVSDTIVNNESSEIIRMFNSVFDACGAAPGDYYPKELRSGIDAWNTRIYHTVNNGVYKAGFATTQDAYGPPSSSCSQRWMLSRFTSTRIATCWEIVTTEADWRLFTTLLRFDPVYFGHFGTTFLDRRLPESVRLSARSLSVPGVAETVDMRHIKGHYYGSHH